MLPLQTYRSMECVHVCMNGTLALVDCCRGLVHKQTQSQVEYMFMSYSQNTERNLNIKIGNKSFKDVQRSNIW
jgi:hypothetical protein